jgi:signal transduction histidine kinase
MTANTSLSVLIVEDSETQLAQLERSLRSFGYDVLLARNGVEALDLLQTQLPKLVISDVIMPEMDGYELCARIKASAKFNDLPVMILTSLSDPKDVIRGLQCGADSFIVKPYEEKALFVRIQYILANKELRAQTGSQMGIEIFFAGEKHLIRSDRFQMIDLLLSAYETAVQKNLAVSYAKEEADRANRAKSEFLSRMSHELRTPMNAILGFAQLLELDELTPDQHEGVSHIIHGGRHLLDLINEVLDLTRIEAGRISLSPEPVEISRALHEAIDFLQPLAAGSEITLRAAPACDYYVTADRQRLRQVLLNLISNAIKYNRPAGSVTVSCEGSDGRARILVSDTGVGIPSQRMEQLFAPFERLGAEHSTVEGTGLGLAVAKRLVEEMEGTLGVESVPGEGSTFWVELPLTESPLTGAKSADEAPEFQPAGSEEKHRVLYVEDNPSNLRLIERVLLRRPSIELLVASDGAQGLELAQGNVPDLVLLDLNLPVLDGHEVLNRLQNDPRTLGIPVVVITADATSRQKDRLLRAGAIDYLTKPLNIKRFLEVLDRALEGAGQVR